MPPHDLLSVLAVSLPYVGLGLSSVGLTQIVRDFGLQGEWNKLACVAIAIALGNNELRYNDDGPCLEEAARHLLRRHETDRLLVVLSDGRPEGQRSTEADLRRVVASLRETTSSLKLVGIGVGSNTDHVTEFYPESIANVPLQQLADQIGGLLQRTLLHGST